MLEEPLTGGNVGTGIVRVGGTVRRPSGPWSASVDALLQSWLISSYRLTESWANWEVHPEGDEIVHCRSGAAELVFEAAGGPDTVTMTPGATVVIPQGTWHTVKVPEEAELLHITNGRGTTFKPVEGEASFSSVPACATADKTVTAPVRVIAYPSGEHLDESRAFYVEVLGFEVAMEQPVLGLTSPANPTAQVIIPPAGFDDPQPQLGVDLGRPEAVDAAHQAALDRGLRVVYPLTDEPWGVRRFFVEDPGGTVINVLAHTA